MNQSDLLFLDVESLGLMGKTKLIQYAEGTTGKVKMFTPDDKEQLEYLRKKLFNPKTLTIAYNAPFDVFKMYQIFGTDNPFLCDVLDLQGHAKLKHELGKYSFQRKGERAIAKLTDIPMMLAQEISDYVVKKLKNKLPKQIQVKGSIHQTKRKGFKTLTFSLDANLRLKSIMQYEGRKTQQIQDVWPIPANKTEDVHNPFEQACHEIIEAEADRIIRERDPKFFKYAKDDILYIQDLYKILGCPEPDHNDTVGHIVAYTKMKGFPIDQKIISDLITDYKLEISKAEDLPFDYKSSKQKLNHFRKKYPKLKLKNCDKHVLKKLAEKGDKEAQKLEHIGSMKQQLDQAIKLATTDDLKAHPDLRVIGTATQRMAGASGFNYQAIGKDSPIRRAILCSCGGDFSSLEVGLAATVYGDSKLSEKLFNGIDLHLDTAVKIHPKMAKYTYEQALVIKKEADELPDHLKQKHHRELEKARKESKIVVFGIIYGATPHAIAELTGLTLDQAEIMMEKFFEEYPEMLETKMQIEKKFCTADTERWTKDSVNKMDKSITDMLGYERSFEFEAKTADYFWQMAQKFDPELKLIVAGLEKIKVVRKEMKGEQTIPNTIRSAMLGAAITIQSSVARSASNSIVQSVGAQLTKKMMVYIWEKTKHRFGVAMLNIHDEIIMPKYYDAKQVEEISNLVQEFIKIWKKMFPHLGMDFGPIGCWADR